MYNYHKILGISSNASIEEIKKAYRQRAKELHPDRNKSPNAHEHFILLSEAYEYALNDHGSGRIKHKHAAPKQDWQTQQREEARARARAHAKMQYEEYIKTDFYKNSQAVFVVWKHFYPISSLFIVVGFPVIGYFSMGFNGIVVGMVLVFLTSPYWLSTFRQKPDFNIRSLNQSILLLAKTNAFNYSAITLMNIYLLFHFTLNTELSTYTFLLIAVLLGTLSFFNSHYITNRLKFITKKFLLVCIVPYIFNLFFLLNFIFSSDPVTEKYSFHRADGTTYLHLENNKYENNHWFRTFFDFDAIRLADNVTYTFEDGFFGLRVLKSYRFHRNKIVY